MTNRLLVATLSMMSFLGILIQFSVVPLMSPIAKGLGASVPAVGQSFTIAFLLGAILALIAGPAGDHYGKRRLLIAGGILTSVGTLTSALAPEFWTFVLGRVVTGVGTGAVSAMGVAVAFTTLPETERRVGIGWIVTGVSLAPIIGFPLIAEIGDRLSWRWSMLALAAMALIGVALARMVIPRDPSWPTEPLRWSSGFQAYAQIIRDGPSMLLQSSNFLRAVSLFSANVYFGAYLIDQVGVSLQAAGYIFLIGGVGYLVGSRLGDGVVIPISLRSLFSVSTLIIGAAFSAMFLLPLGWIVVSVLYFIASAGAASGFVALNILIVESTPGGTSTAMTLRQSAFSLGIGGGGALGGVLIAAGGFAAVGIFSLLIATAAAFIVYWRVPVATGEAPNLQSSQS